VDYLDKPLNAVNEPAGSYAPPFHSMPPPWFGHEWASAVIIAFNPPWRRLVVVNASARSRNDVAPVKPSYS
jgi:hypothetical protein